jgi:hypothetical protein
MAGIRLTLSCAVFFAVLQSLMPRLLAQQPDSAPARTPAAVSARTALRFVLRPMATESALARRALPVPRAALRPSTPAGGMAAVLQRPSALSGFFAGVVSGAACPQGSPTLSMRDRCWQMTERGVGGVWRLFGDVLGQTLTSDRWRELRSLRDNRLDRYEGSAHP